MYCIVLMYYVYFENCFPKKNYADKSHTLNLCPCSFIRLNTNFEPNNCLIMYVSVCGLFISMGTFYVGHIKYGLPTGITGLWSAYIPNFLFHLSLSFQPDIIQLSVFQS